MVSRKSRKGRPERRRNVGAYHVGNVLAVLSVLPMPLKIIGVAATVIYMMAVDHTSGLVGVL